LVKGYVEGRHGCAGAAWAIGGLGAISGPPAKRWWRATSRAATAAPARP